MLAELGKLGVKPASDLTTGENGTSADRLAVLPALRGILPRRGVARGSTVAVPAATGSTSLLLGLLSQASQDGAWCAVVGVPDLGLAAAAHMGIALERLAVIASPGPQAAAVAASLLDGFDIVALAAPGLSASACSQLSARARTTGSVLIALSAWSGANLVLSAESSAWHGRGRLRCRKISMTVGGRGRVGRPEQAEVWLPDDAEFRKTITERVVVDPPRRLQVVR